MRKRVNKDFSIQTIYEQALHRILITGGAGFIGHHVVRHLAHDNNNDYGLVVIDNLSNGKFDFDDKEKKNISFYKEDVRNKETISDIVKREPIDACIHLAANFNTTIAMTGQSILSTYISILE